MRKFKNAWNYVPSKGRFVSPVSEAVPGQAFTVSEILERSKLGLPTNSAYRGETYYDENDTFPDVSTLDLAERQQLRDDYTRQLSEIRKKQGETLKKQKAAENEAEKARYKAFAETFMQERAKLAEPEKSTNTP